MMLWRIAWRNLWRHRGRTLIIGSAVALAYGLLLLALAINDYAEERMLSDAAKAAGGDVLVHADGYWDSRGTDLVLRDADAALSMIRELDGVETALPRVLTFGLVSTPVDNRPVMLQGIDPELENALHGYERQIVEGSFLADNRRTGIVLGSRLAERLEVDLGDRVVLTGTRPDGEMTRALFHLTGILSTGIRELDEVTGFTTLETAQRALGMEGAVTQIGILTGGGASADAVRAAVVEALAARSNDIEVLTWSDAVPEMVALMRMDEILDTIFMAMIFVVVLFSITNTFMMAVMERVRELGLLNALGLKHSEIGRLMLRETVLLTAVAMAAGLALAFIGHVAVSQIGIPLSAWGMDEIEMGGIALAHDMTIYSKLIPIKWVVTSVVVAAATVGAALYPAWRATRLAPAEAMRFYE